MSRRAVLAGATGLAAPSLPRFARASEVIWRVGHSAPVEFPLHLRLVEAARLIAARSAGRMEVQIHPASELGGAVGLLAQTRAGSIDAAPLTGKVLARDLAVAALPTLGFAFPDYAQLWSAMDGGLGGFLRARLNERLNLVAMDTCWDFGFREITTSGKVVQTPRDIEGLRLRTPAEAGFIELLRALKVLPIPMPLRSLERALGSHAVDGQEGVLPLVKAAGLFRVQSACALSHHVWDGQWLCISAKSWGRLPAKLQDIVAATLNESARRQRQDVAAAEADLREDLAGEGMTFNTVDMQGFRSALRSAGYYAACRTRMGEDGWAVLEKSTGGLA
ncbi:MAG TPA: TRAP transporter substrate-binding protein [Rhodopila sp.]